jgi:hypothetical protein
VCHNAPIDGDIVGTVNWTKVLGASNASATESVVNYDGSNCFLIQGLAANLGYTSSMSFIDEFSAANAAVLTAQFQTNNNILGTLTTSNFSTHSPATIASTTKLNTLTKDGGSLTVRLDMADYDNVTSLVVQMYDGTSWSTEYSGVSSEIVDIQVPVGTFQLRVKSVIVFSDGTEDSSSYQVYTGDDVVVDAVLDAASGLTARTLILSASSFIFPFDKDGISVGSDIILTAKQQNVVEGTLVWTAVPNIGTDNLDGTYTITPSDFGVLDSVKITCAINDLSDSVTLVRLQEQAGVGGAPGDTIYIEYQYSIDGSSLWHPTLVTGDKYRQERIVTNGTPAAWSTAALIAGVSGDPGDTIYIEYQYSIDGSSLWHPTLVTGDKYRQERIVTNGTPAAWSTAALITGADGTDGVSSVSVVLTNSNHTLPAEEDGAVSVLSNSGTDIHVYEGITELVYDGVGTSAGTWKVTASASNVTMGAISDQGTYAEVANLVGMSTSSPIGSISYTVQGKLLDGTSFTAAPSIQSFSKSTAGLPAKGLRLLSTALTFKYDTDDAPIGASSIVLTAELLNVTGTVVWGFSSTGGTFTGGSASSNTYTVTEAQFSGNDSVTITATVGSYSDSVTIVKLRDGGIGPDGISAITAILSNAAHSVPADKDGVVTSTVGSGTEIRVYEGTTLLNYDSAPSAGEWQATPSLNNITGSSSVADSGAYGTMPDITDMSADTGSITYTITGNRLDGVAFATITIAQSFSLSKQGVDGTEGSRGATNVSLVVSTATLSSGWGAAANTAADSITPGDNIIGDRVTLLDNGNYIETRVWDGDSWETIDQVIDGSILFPGSVVAAALAANTITANEINVDNLFSTSITASGSITYQSGSNSAVLGGGNLITASDSSGVVFSIGTGGTGILNSSILIGELPGSVIGQEALNVIQNFLGTTAPSTGGKSSSSFSANTTTKTVTLEAFNHGTNTPSISFSGDVAVLSEGTTIADSTINVQIFRIVDDGTPTSIYNTDIPSVHTVAAGGNHFYRWNPSFSVSDAGAPDGTSVKYRVTLSSISTDMMPINCTFSAEEVAVGDAGTTYTLPAATDSILGGVIVGAGLSVASGVLSADAQSSVTVSSVPTNGATTEAISSDWAFDNVKTSVPLGAVFTDNNTTYSAGTGMSLSGTTFNCTVVNTDTDTTYSAGTGMSLSGTTFNCDIVNTDTTYSAGTGLTLTGTSFSINLGTTSTTAAAGNHNHSGVYQPAGTYNTTVGTNSDINTSGALVVDQLNMTSGVITSHSTRTLTLANLGYTGATNATNVTNNSQISNGASYITNSGGTTTATGNTVAKRDSNADISTRTIKANLSDSSIISGAIAYRTSSSDGFLRYCNNTTGIRSYLDVPTKSGGNATGTWGIDISGKAAQCTVTVNSNSNGTYGMVWTNGSHSLYRSDGLTYEPDNKLLRCPGELRATGVVQGSDCIATSDIRAKVNFEPILNALDKVCLLNGLTYDHLEKQGDRAAGHIAQEVEKVLPEAIYNVEDDRLGTKKVISATAIPALHTEAIKELKAKNDTLEARIAKLEELLSNG